MECAEVTIRNNHSQLSKQPQDKTHSLKFNCSWKKIVETILLVSIFIIVWCLFAIPTVLYAISASQSSQGTQGSLNETKTSSAHSCTGELVNQSEVNSCSNLSSLENHTIICAEGFYLGNSDANSTSRCIPLCGFWISTSRNLGNAVVAAISLVSAIISSLIMVVLAFWLQRDIILVYPTTYLVYICLSFAAASSVLLIGIFIKDTVFCSSDNLFESLEHETPFCTISGFVHMYALGQVSLWIVFHAFGLLRGVAFPFFYRKIKEEGALKYIHISTVIIALVLPLVPALLHLIDGYSVVLSPVNICIGRNIAITYYSLVLPISILFATTTTILILLLRKILKEFMIKPVVNSASKGHIRKAQAKLFLIKCYYTLFGVVTITSFTLHFTMNGGGSESFQTYYVCQSSGVHTDFDCGQPPNNAFHTFASVSIILGGLMPGVILIFTVKCSRSKKCCQTTMS